MAKTDEILDMSDEDFLNLGSTAFKPAPAADETTPAPATDDPDTDEIEEDGEDVEETDDTGGGEVPVASAKATEGTTDNKPDATIDKPADKSTEPVGEPDYAAIGKLLMSEFKANGSTLKMKSAEDAIQLMQMGANYHKKMAGLKPSLKTLKLLENNGLLDPEKLNYLIDLSQKKPEAITQLLRDSKIDPMTIDLDGKENYVPAHRVVNDTELLLDEVLDSISDSPSYNKTLNVLGEVWDASSRAAIAKNPEVIRAINMHMENGIYDQVVTALNYERSLGKLTGLSDYDAYQRVGTYMHENNLFVNAANVNQPNGNQTNHNQNPKLKSASDAQTQQRLDRKQAASPSRQQKAVAADNANYNPLEMSDEDFIKLNKLRI